jgi:uncharacterized protein (TIGR03000 family)
MKRRAAWVAGCVALAVVCGSTSAGLFSGGIGSAMYYGPYTGTHNYSYATAYSYNLPFTPNGFSSPWVFPYTNDWTSSPWNGYAYPGRPLFHKTPPYFTAPAPADLPAGPGEAGVVAGPAPAVVCVHVPADAEVWFDGSMTQQAGSDRTFASPPLPGGKAFHYAVRARWTEGGKSFEQFQMVTVQAGRQSQVRFPQ